MSNNEDKDLTRIEDLAEFLHDDSDDNLFGDDDADKEIDETPPLPSLDDLDDDADLEALPVDTNQDENETPPNFESDEVDDALEEASFGGSEFDENTNSSFDSSTFEQEGDSDPFSSSDDFEQEDTLSFGLENEESQAEDEPQEEMAAIDSGDEDTDSHENDENTQTNNQIEQEAEAIEVEMPSIDDEQEPASVDDFEPATVSSYEPEPQPQESRQPQQNFEDLRQFAENISYGAVAQGGNPPFSLILRGIKYQDEAEDIMIILREHGLVSDENEQGLEQGLANGSLLISQISEYSAIYLAHRFRRFDLDVIVGLSDEIHPSQSYDADARGLVSKQSIRQNIHESFDLERAPVKINNIMLTTTPTLEGYTIREYLGIISHHSVLSSNEIEEFSPGLTETGDEVVDAIQRDLKDVLEKHGSDDEEIRPFGQGLEALYHDMADALRSHALKIGANAIVGINYQLTPIIKNEGRNSDIQYKVTCLGSAVWVVGD